MIVTNPEVETAIHQQLPTQRCVYRIAITPNRDAFFGSLHPVKGLETLLPAFKQVQQMQPQAHLILIGGVESLALRGTEAKQYWEQLHSLIARLDLSAVVHFTSYVDAKTASHY